MKNISECVQEMHYFFYSRKTYDISLRIHYLKKLKHTILESQKEIVAALYKDFKKPAFETYSTEIYTTISQINYVIAYIEKWSKPTRMQGVLPLIGSYTKVLKEPYGVCLIFSPFNYPFQLTMIPLIGAISSGNCAIIKPSEYTPHTNRLIQRIINTIFPSYYVSLFQGGADVSEALLAEPIDYVFFTGGTETGKKVMSQAAEKLVPVTLELGGKSPVIVDYDADLKIAAKRIVWGKFLNAGQTCVAPDYVLVHEQVAEQLLRYIAFTIQHFYKHKKNIARIINERHYVRLLKLIDEDKIYYGGHFNTNDLYIEPTILYPITSQDACMQEEIFGPILPVIPFQKLEEARNFVQRYPKPLSCYLFANNTNRINYFLKHLSFGGGCINDTILHLTHNNAPFGGVGQSGIGAYHGYHSFKTFTHEKTILISSKKELPFRYPPYDKQLKFIQKLIR